MIFCSDSQGKNITRVKAKSQHVFLQSQNPSKHLLSHSISRMFIFQHPAAADCAVGDLISRDKLTLQGLMFHLDEASYMEHTLLEQEWGVFAIHWLMHRPKLLPGGSAAAKPPQNVWLLQSPVCGHIKLCSRSTLYMTERTAWYIGQHPGELEELIHQIWAKKKRKKTLLETTIDANKAPQGSNLETRGWKWKKQHLDFTGMV